MGVRRPITYQGRRERIHTPYAVPCLIEVKTPLPTRLICVTEGMQPETQNMLAIIGYCRSFWKHYISNAKRGNAAILSFISFLRSVHSCKRVQPTEPLANESADH